MKRPIATRRKYLKSVVSLLVAYMFAVEKYSRLFACFLGNRLEVHLPSVLSDSPNPSNLNASTFLTVKSNIMLNPIFGMLSSRAIRDIPGMIGYLYWLKS